MIALKNLKLWWPAWQMGIPVNAYGFIEKGKAGVYGTGYRFDVDLELDSWLTEDNKLMPVATSKLFYATGSTLTEIPFTSFVICNDGRVQVNTKLEGTVGSYNIDMYSLENLYIDGESYSEDD